MTAIIGFIKNKKVYIGGDSIASNGYNKDIRKDGKIFENNGFIFGCTTSFRMIQILQFSFKPPKQKGKELFEYMCTDFVDAIREQFKKSGYEKKESDGEDKGGVFIVGRKGRLFKIESDFQVGEYEDFTTCGCGGVLATGAMEVLKDSKLSPSRIIEKALWVTEKFDVNVSRPFKVIKTK